MGFGREDEGRKGHPSRAGHFVGASAPARLALLSRVKLEASAEYLTWKQKVSVVKNKFGKPLICARGSMSFSLTLTTQNSATRTTSLFLSAFPSLQSHSLIGP